MPGQGEPKKILPTYPTLQPQAGGAAQCPELDSMAAETGRKALMVVGGAWILDPTLG